MCCYKPVFYEDDFSSDPSSTLERTSHFFSMWGPLLTQITLYEDQLESHHNVAVDQNIFYSEVMAFMLPPENMTPPNLSSYNRENKKEFYANLGEWIQGYCESWKQELDLIDNRLTRKNQC